MSPSSDGAGGSFLSAFSMEPEKRKRSLVVIAAVAVGLAATLGFGTGLGLRAPDLGPVTVGRAADRDIIAERKISFVDEKATKLRLETEEKLVLPVFELDPKARQSALDRLSSFASLVSGLAAAKTAPATLSLKVQSAFPGLFSRQEIAAMAGAPSREQIFADADAILGKLMDRGIFAFPAAGLEPYNEEYLELRRGGGLGQDSREIARKEAVVLEGLSAAVAEETKARRLAPVASADIAAIVGKFAVENAFFDREASERKLEAARRQVEPVVRTIAPGERIVRKGVVVTEADYARLVAAREAVSKPDWRRLLGDSGFFLLASALAILLLGRRVSGSSLGFGETILLSVGLILPYVAALALARLGPPVDPMFIGLLLPAALGSLVFTVFAGPRFSYLFGICVSLLVMQATDYDGRAFLFTLLSTIAATVSIRDAESRMELVRAGVRLAVGGAFGAALLSLPFVGDFRQTAFAFMLGGLNGLLSSLVAIWLFPVIEQALNVPTRFRLIELSDLDAPAMRRLLAAAPGTYSHSVAVAHLAEAAAREIGADALLARVGAYYHDIGKVEQPEYFVENQSGYNRHDEINPRLSATVIRSHVKLGIEKAKALGLPREVVDIVAEHHGNALISWFFDRANREEGADPEDFSYPGQPPTSREAAIVMLADAAEAASRTLKKPTPARIDGLLRDIFLDRVKQNQLALCELTFKDLETVRASFTKILSGQHHARIEYPKTAEEDR